MSNIWTPPKVDWNTDTGIDEAQLNAIGNNMVALAQRPICSGLEFFGNTSEAGAGAYNVRVIGRRYKGTTYEAASVKGLIHGDFDIKKVLSAADWAAGNGESSPCKAGGFFAADQWWYVFLLYNPTTDSFDLALDSSPQGLNIQGGTIETAGFTMWQCVGAVCELDGGLVSTHGLDNWFFQGQPVPNYVADAGSVSSSIVVANLSNSFGVNLLPTFVYSNVAPLAVIQANVYTTPGGNFTSELTLFNGYYRGPVADGFGFYCGVENTGSSNKGSVRAVMRPFADAGVHQVSLVSWSGGPIDVYLNTPMWEFRPY